MMSERTLLPVLIPLAPPSTLLARLPTHRATVLAAHHVPDEVIQDEVEQMRRWQLAPTNNRGRVGSLNEFAQLAEHARHEPPGEDLIDLSLWLATVPCGPCTSAMSAPTANSLP